MEHNNIAQNTINKLSELVKLPGTRGFDCRLFEALTGIYFASYYVSLEDYSFRIIKRTDYAQKMVTENSDVRDVFDIFVNTIVMPAYRDRVKAFCDVTTLAKRLSDRKYIECEYKCNVWDNWCIASFVVVDRCSNGDANTVLFNITHVDDCRTKELEELQKETEQNLEISKKSISLALKVVNQLIMEYDPVLHTGDCYADDNCFGLPKHMDDFPQSLIKSGFIHHDDAEDFVAAVKEMDAGAIQAQCDVRFRQNGSYVWYACFFNSFFNQEKNRDTVVMMAVDISFRVLSIKNYDEQVRTLIADNSEALTEYYINLTQDKFELVSTDVELQHFIDDASSFHDAMLKMLDSIVDVDDKTDFVRLFARENLLELAAKGVHHVQKRILLKISENHYKWLNFAVDLIRNPITDEIGGVAYAADAQSAYMSERILDSTLKRDYIYVAAVFSDTDEFYMAGKDGYSNVINDFWQYLQNTVAKHTDGVVCEQMRRTLKKDYVVRKLNLNKEFCYAFNSSYHDKEGRFEIRFRYLDERKTMILATLRNITDRALLDRLRHDNEHDRLTDLYNRYRFFESCSELLSSYQEEEFAMIHIDIKRFKLYNAFYGEMAGDKLLCYVADIIRETAGEYDHIAYGRVDADVYGIFLPYDNDVFRGQAKYLVKRLNDFRGDFLIEPAIGIYPVNDRSMPIESMFSRATMAAKSQKKIVGEPAVTYDEEMERKAVEEQQIVSEMKTALDEEQFAVYLQPKYSLVSRRPVGAEALVRWEHPEKGIVSPAKFIPVFEGNGFITELDHYMWEHVCMLLKKWKDEGKTLAPISVNVSRISMFNPETVKILKGLIKKYEVEPRLLELELTESAIIDDPDEMDPQIEELRESGFRILMDDFGSGYSSLNTLKELPVDCLKLDMKFLSNNKGARGDIVIESVVKLAGRLDLGIIAEGVEQKEQADFLKSTGCDCVQGFLFAKPMTVSEYEKTQIPRIKADN